MLVPRMGFLSFDKSFWDKQTESKRNNKAPALGVIPWQVVEEAWGKEAEKINKQDSHFFSDYFYYIEKEDQFQISLAKYKTNLAIFHYPMSG